MTSGMTTVLVDNSVLSFGVVAHGAAVGVPGFENRLLLIQAKSSRASDESWLKEQIECLPTIARLAREGAMKLYSYEELTLEAWKRPGSYPANPFGDVFTGITIDDVPSAVRRSLFFQSDMSQYIKTNALITFCKWLLNIDSTALLQVPSMGAKLTDFERRNLNSLSRFKDICIGLSEKQYGDAFHLWTAEANGLSYLLTADRKFVRAVTNDRKRTLPCQPIFPCDLLEVFDVKGRDPMPYEYGRRYMLSGQQ